MTWPQGPPQGDAADRALGDRRPLHALLARLRRGGIDLIERGRGALLLERFERSWPAYRGRAIRPLVRERRPFGRAEAAELAASRPDVPGADADTLLVGVSAQGFGQDAPLDTRLAPEDLVDAWRR